jgi:acetyl/propionyl-CoA carboxylase alpha subunit
MTSSFYLWDQVAGTSTVSWQLATLRNSQVPKELKTSSPQNGKYGISLKIFAEDSRFLLPRPGVLKECFASWEEEKEGKLVRVCSNYKEGNLIPSSGSGVLGQLFATSESPDGLLSWTKACLRKFWIAGSIQTNEQFLLELLEHPWVREQMFHAGFLDEEFLSVWKPTPEMLQACIALCQEVSHPSLGASRWIVGEYSVQSQLPEKNEANWTWVRPPEFWEFEGRKGLSGEIRFKSGEELRVCVFPLKQRWFVRMGSWSTSVRQAVTGGAGDKKPQPKLFALVTGRVHALLFRSGVTAPGREPLLVVESLGVFIPHAVPVAIRILQWKVKPNEEVYFGQELAEIEYSNELKIPV